MIYDRMSLAAAPKKMARWEKTAAVKLCNHTCLDDGDDQEDDSDGDICMIIDIDILEKESPSSVYGEAPAKILLLCLRI